MNNSASWGNFKSVTQKEISLYWRNENIPSIDLINEKESILPVGNKRSYGDVCLNENNTIIRTNLLNKFISFDASSGILTCESGILLNQVLSLIVPKGWFLPVTPGTKFITIGGAIANDIHGKNHHKSGCFGNFVKKFELKTTDQKSHICSKDLNKELFEATIGGLGLTGIILWVELQLIPIKSRLIDSITVKFSSLEEFFEISAENNNKYVYSVSWIDCVSKGAKSGRGIYMAGNHFEQESPKNISSKRGFSGYIINSDGIPKFKIPFYAPSFALNKYTMSIFNEAYYSLNRSKISKNIIDYEPFFYPLDIVNNWNKLYGKNGFFQFQCVITKEGLTELFKFIIQTGQGSFLAVLKEFGNIKSNGMLSFPRNGVTLALDFANKGEETVKILNKLEKIVLENAGRIYPAKDACMSKQAFKQFFPEFEKFSKFIDPNISSSFLRRVT